MGLHNTDIQLCHKQVNIDASPVYPVLNIAQAIQILCYEIYQASCNSEDKNTLNEFPINQDLEYFYQAFEKVLNQSGFLDKDHSSQAMVSYRALFRRARPNKKELKQHLFFVVFHLNNKHLQKVLVLKPKKKN